MIKYKKNIFNFYFPIVFIILLLIYLSDIIKKFHQNVKLGIICLEHSQNIGNNLLKFAMYYKISELGYNPVMIGTKAYNNNISFIQNAIKIRIIQKNFSEIKENDYDILMVNSDQTWFKFDKNFYDYGFLRFAENWTIPKIVYGASLGFNKLHSKQDNKIAKTLLKKFQGISVREESSIKLIIKHLGIQPEFVLDPTFLFLNIYY